MTDGQSALPPGNHTEGRDYEEDQQNDGETIWMSIGMKPPGREQHKIGKLGNNILRPSPNHGTIRLIYRYIYIHIDIYILLCLPNNTKFYFGCA